MPNVANFDLCSFPVRKSRRSNRKKNKKKQKARQGSSASSTSGPPPPPLDPEEDVGGGIEQIGGPEEDQEEGEEEEDEWEREGSISPAASYHDDVEQLLESFRSERAAGDRDLSLASQHFRLVN
jgi:hypothetical protein